MRQQTRKIFFFENFESRVVGEDAGADEDVDTAEDGAVPDMGLSLLLKNRVLLYLDMELLPSVLRDFKIFYDGNGEIMRKSFATRVRKDIYESTEWMPLEEGIFSEARKHKTAVVGIGSGAGATFTAANLAYVMAKSVDGVCYIDREYQYLSGVGSGRAGQVVGIQNKEMNERFAYRSIPLDRVLSSRRAVDYFVAEQRGAPYGNRRNLYANVNWVVHLPEENAHGQGADIEYARYGKTEYNAEFKTEADKESGKRREAEVSERKFRYAAGAQGFALRGGDGLKQERIPGRYLILDEPPIARLTEAEMVICVVDPLPSRLHSGMEKLICLRENRIKAGRKFSPALNLPTPVIWVLNKDNSQVSHRELEQFLKIRFDFVLPLLDERIFYRAEYSGVPIFKLPEFTKQGQTEFERLAKHVLKETNCTI